MKHYISTINHQRQQQQQERLYPTHLPDRSLLDDDQDSRDVVRRNSGSPPTSPPAHSVLRGMQSPPPLVPCLVESVEILDDSVITQQDAVNFGYEHIREQQGRGFHSTDANTANSILPRGQCLQPRDVTVPLWNTLSFCSQGLAKEEEEDDECNVDKNNPCDVASCSASAATAAARATATTSYKQAVNGHGNDVERTLHVLSLPLDSLHTIASFLQVKEWKTFGVASRDAALACRDVFRKVKMHAFYCAVEVVTAWNRGEHADAEELAALYIHSGVPIYPVPLGHSYHTVHWRMKVESDAMKQRKENSDDDSSHNGQEARMHVDGLDAHSNTILSSSSTSSSETLFETRNGQLDRFYIDRNDSSRTMGGHYLPTLTYLEEKGLYWSSKNKGTPIGQLSLQQRYHYSQRFHARPQSSFPARGFSFLGFYDDHQDDDNMPDMTEQRRQFDTRQEEREVDGLEGRDAFASIGRPDNDGRYQKAQCCRDDVKKESLNDPKLIIYCHKHLIDRHLQGKASVADEHGDMDSPPMSLSADFFHPIISRPHHPKTARVLNALERPPSRRQERVENALAPSDADRIASIPDVDAFVEHSVMSEIELCSYDSKSGEASNIWSQIAVYKKLKPSDFMPLRNKNEMADIISHFQRKLMSLLQRGDFSACDDCMLDFWDVFFPRTNTVHYFDRYTPVPRMSKLHTFLTRPCPKAFGTMQCEIERIRVRYRTKGMVAGRYYTTYEYRLFIRDRRALNNEGNQQHEPCRPRMDTILMTAKYRGKHYSGSSGLTQLSHGKNGANQYCVFLPQQSDIDEHFDNVNENVNLNSSSIGKQSVPASGSTLELCRIQANFMGTEFQITSPLLLNDANKEKIIDGAVSGDANTGEHRGILGTNKSSYSLLNFMKKDVGGKANHGAKRQGSNRSSRIAVPRITPFSLKKQEPSDSIEPQPSDSGVVYPSHAGEKEIAAITYTANVLGNRPRIMNVGIPKICSDTGMPKTTWLKSSGEEGRMMNCLKSLGQRTNENNERNQDGNPIREDNGLMSLQNRPPWWNVELGAFVLNFGGRVSVASVKNFQLCEQQDHNNIMLQFGRIEGRHSFTMDFSYPLSPLQAFAVSISSLQSKISL